jgi:molybdate-binding protein
MPISFWRSSDKIEQLNRLDRSGFAAEFLRRNAGYRTDHTRTLRRIAQGRADPGIAKAELASRWGLCFCPRS